MGTQYHNRQAQSIFDHMYGALLHRVAVWPETRMLASKLAADFVRDHLRPMATIMDYFELPHPEHCCIVGKSSCDAGNGFGIQIDSYPYVWRFHAWSPEPQHERDYGKKCTHVFSTLGFPGIYTFDRALVVATKQDKDSERLSNAPTGVPLAIMPQDIKSSLASRLNEISGGLVCPSTGITLLWWYWSVYGRLPRIFAMDLWKSGSPYYQDQSQFFPEEYWKELNSGSYKCDGTAPIDQAVTHNPKAEQVLLKEMIGSV